MIVRLAAHAMATRFEIVLDGEDEVLLRAAGEEALAAIEETHRRLSWFDPGSLLSHLNRRAAAGPVTVDDDLLELLAECREVHRASEGAFDITVAPLMERWGFRAAAASAVGRQGAAAPSPEACSTVPAPAAAVTMDDVELDHARRTVRFRCPATSIDLGGVGKGHGLDLAAGVLREHGIERALLHGGTSSVVAIGAPPGADGWPVAVRGAEPLVVTLRDEALSVSAPDGRTAAAAHGGRVGHVIDPRTAAPAAGVRLAAVVGPTARLADAWSTALVVLGRRPPGMPEALAALVVPERGDESRPEPLGRRSREVFELAEPRGAAVDT